MLLGYLGWSVEERLADVYRWCLSRPTGCVTVGHSRSALTNWTNVAAFTGQVTGPRLLLFILSLNYVLMYVLIISLCALTIKVIIIHIIYIAPNQSM